MGSETYLIKTSLWIVTGLTKEVMVLMDFTGNDYQSYNFTYN